MCIKRIYIETQHAIYVLDDDEICVNLLEKIEKANEASFLVRGVSDMYVNVSVKYIMDESQVKVT